jgi:hypothetical protein
MDRWCLHSYTNYNSLVSSWWENGYERKLDLTHLRFVAQQCKLQVWGRYVSIPSKAPLIQNLILIWR